MAHDNMISYKLVEMLPPMAFFVKKEQKWKFAMLLHCQTLYLESLRFATLQRAFSLFQAISLLIHLSTISADLDMSEIIYATWQNAYCTVGPQNYPREPLIKYVSFRTFSLPKAHIMSYDVIFTLQEIEELCHSGLRAY